MSLEEKVFPIIAWTIIVGCLWAANWWLLGVRDKRPKEGIRCRKCFYRVRGIASDQCPECGVDLRESGVWRDKEPSRSGIIHITALVAWFAYVGTALVVQWLAVQQTLPISFEVGEAISIVLLLSVWLLPVGVAIGLRVLRNRRAIISWPCPETEDRGAES